MNQRPVLRNNRARNNRPNNSPPTRPNRAPVQHNSEIPTGFHNPYNFIPALPRKSKHVDLGDHHPKGHGLYHANLWSGRLAVSLTTKTPLLIPDAAKVNVIDVNVDGREQKHKIFPVRVDKEGKPYLAPTSVKGMLRTAYEAVTNSRFGVFEAHDKRLAYRRSARQGVLMVPVRIEQGEACLYTGTATIGNGGRPQGAMYAAWLPRYGSAGALKYANEALPQHGDHVTMYLELYNKCKRNGEVIFSYWKVKRIAKITSSATQQLGAELSTEGATGSHQPTGQLMGPVNGYVYISNNNIERKHDERVFFCNQAPRRVALNNDVKKRWETLITNYQTTHEVDLDAGKRGPAEGVAWSRHVTVGASAKSLGDGTLCYALVSGRQRNYTITDLYPVTISRGLYEKSPRDLVSTTLLPASNMGELSPADRVFGWVNQQGKGAYKGNLRVGGVTCHADGPTHGIKPFRDNPLTLAILGQPNPQQFRFYLQDSQQKPSLPMSKIEKSEGYAESQALRGRKVYPHHRHVTAAHWEAPNGTNREYVERNRTNQNRSIEGWVKPGVTFTFNIDVTNLSEVELGALLWLLKLPDEHYHRVGSGKPLGFGSVALSLDEESTDLRTGTQWQQFYSSLSSIPSPRCEFDTVIESFQKAVVDTDDAVAAEEAEVYNNPMAQALLAAGQAIAAQDTFDIEKFNNIAFIKAFLVMARGFKTESPVCYPRTTALEGDGFDWFVANESKDRVTNRDNRYSLPLLTADSTELPILEKRNNR